MRGPGARPRARGVLTSAADYCVDALLGRVESLLHGLATGLRLDELLAHDVLHLAAPSATTGGSAMLSSESNTAWRLRGLALLEVGAQLRPRPRSAELPGRRRDASAPSCPDDVRNSAHFGAAAACLLFAVTTTALENTADALVVSPGSTTMSQLKGTSGTRRTSRCRCATSRACRP